MKNILKDHKDIMNGTSEDIIEGIIRRNRRSIT